MNLAEFVKDPFTEEASFDQEGFKQAIHVAVRALNDVLEEGLLPIPWKNSGKVLPNGARLALALWALVICSLNGPDLRQ